MHGSSLPMAQIKKSVHRVSATGGRRHPSRAMRTRSGNPSLVPLRLIRALLTASCARRAPAGERDPRGRARRIRDRHRGDHRRHLVESAPLGRRPARVPGLVTRPDPGRLHRRTGHRRRHCRGRCCRARGRCSASARPWRCNPVSCRGIPWPSGVVWPPWLWVLAIVAGAPLVLAVGAAPRIVRLGRIEPDDALRRPD